MEKKYFEVLRKLQDGSEVLEGFSAQELGRFLRLVSPKPYKAGTRIFDKGDAATSLYLILTGRVEIFNMNLSGNDSTHKTLAELKSGEIFGEMSLILQRTRTASAKAGDDVMLFEVSEKLLESDYEMMAKIWKNIAVILAKRLEEANKR